MVINAVIHDLIDMVMTVVWPVTRTGAVVNTLTEVTLTVDFLKRPLPADPNQGLQRKQPRLSPRLLIRINRAAGNSPPTPWSKRHVVIMTPS